MYYKLYASYGVLAHEKQPVFSDSASASEAYSVITVDIPDEYALSENCAGETLIEIDGKTHLLRDVLTNVGDDPYLMWYDGKRTHSVELITV